MHEYNSENFCNQAGVTILIQLNIFTAEKALNWCLYLKKKQKTLSSATLFFSIFLLYTLFWNILGKTFNCY